MTKEPFPQSHQSETCELSADYNDDIGRPDSTKKILLLKMNHAAVVLTATMQLLFKNQTWAKIKCETHI